LDRGFLPVLTAVVRPEAGEEEKVAAGLVADADVAAATACFLVNTVLSE
jgi:hypothetical protein